MAWLKPIYAYVYVLVYKQCANMYAYGVHMWYMYVMYVCDVRMWCMYVCSVHTVGGGCLPKLWLWATQNTGAIMGSEICGSCHTIFCNQNVELTLVIFGSKTKVDTFLMHLIYLWHHSAGELPS